MAEAFAMVKVGNNEWLFENETPRSRSSAMCGAVWASTIAARRPSAMKTTRLFGRLVLPVRGKVWVAHQNAIRKARAEVIQEASRFNDYNRAIGVQETSTRFRAPRSDHFQRFVLAGRRECCLDQVQVILRQFPTGSASVLPDVIDFACLGNREQTLPPGEEIQGD